MKKGMNRRLGLIFGLLLIIFILTIRTGTAFATANSDDNGNGGNSAKTFSIQSSGDYTKKASITKLVVNAGQVFPIYIYAINNGNAQAPAVNQNIPVQVTLFDPNNNQTFQTNIIIPIGPANTYGTLNISGSLPGKWTVQVVGNPGKGTVTVRDTFTIIGQQPTLSVTPNQSTITLGNTQQFTAIYSDATGNKTDVTQSVTWSSSNLSVAAISSAGLATSSNQGTSTITARYTINGVTYSNTSLLTVELPTLDVSPDTTTISLGSSQQYQAVRIDSYDSSTDVTQSVTWFSSNTGVATISPSGLVTGKGAGSCTITATYLINGFSVQTTASLTVVNFSISPSAKIISLGSTLQYSAIITDALGKVTDVTQSVTWSSTSVGSVQLSTISPYGLVTSKGLGTCLIQATYIINGVSITTSASLTIIKPVLSITPTTAMIMLGSTQQFQATLTDYDGNPKNVTAAVTWSSNKLNVATIDQATGIATGVGVGNSTITGTYIINGESITATTLLKIVNLSITPTSSTVWTGYETSFRAILIDYTGNSTDVTSSVSWSSNSLPGLASVIFNQQPGLGTAYGVGTCTITAMDPISKAYGTAALTIIMPDLSITPLSKNIMPGSYQQYQAVLTDSNGNTRDVTSSADWISNNSSVATVDKGLAIGGNVAGTCRITANDIKSGASNSATLTVMAPTQLRLTLANTEPLSIGGNVQVTAALVYPDNSTKDVINSVTWISSNFNVATVDSTGKLTGIGGGQCIITATDSGSGLSGTVTLTVLPTLTISPPSRRILVGDKLQYNAQLIYVDGTVPKDVTGGVTWNSSNSGVASITTSGLANGIGDGSCNITATFNGSQSNSANLTVVPTNTIKTLIITPVPAVDAIFKDATQQFKAQWQFADGSTSDVTNSVDWSSSVPKVATIDDTGLALGIDAGTSMISATIIVDGKRWTGSYLLTVLPSKGGIIRSWEQ